MHCLCMMFAYSYDSLVPGLQNPMGYCKNQFAASNLFPIRKSANFIAYAFYGFLRDAPQKIGYRKHSISNCEGFVGVAIPSFRSSGIFIVYIFGHLSQTFDVYA